MTAEQQLERSVLEGKERDELSAIAQAMSLRTTTRTKKADIIDRILEATGVIPGEATGNGSVATAVPARSGTRAGNGDDHEAGADGAPAPNAARATGTRSAGRRPRAVAPEAGATGTGTGTGVPGEITSAVAGNGHADARPVLGEGEQAEPGPTASPAGLGVPAESREQGGPGNQVGPGNQGGPGNQVGPGNQGGPGNQHRQQGRGNVGNQQGGLDTANRRGRRRRGRERVAGGERELQGGANQESPYQGDLVEVRGLLDLRDEGYGFLRCDGYLPSGKDVYVSISQARRFALRKGDYVEGACRPASNNEKYPALLRIDSVSGLDPEAARARPRFEDLTPLFPDSKLNLEMPGDKDNVTARIVDLLSPVGKGQRGLIVSPPKAGKTTVMKQIAHSIEANNPEVHLMVLLVDERPEEVTDMRRSVKGEVVASTFDRPADEHTVVAELAIERAKRLVEMGKDVVIILDGITRLARAYNLAAPATGRIMSGGVDSGALYPPKKFFGAARNIEEGGSLTILATALVETGSKMDEVIFEEFKGTGNMELRLDRRLAERRLYPSIDVNASSTRHEELLFDRGQLQQVWKLRRVLNALASDGNAASGLELLMDKIRSTRSNDEFLAEIAKGPTLN
ncbi:MAG TPA: transcription termination factor Rho [Acidimicrobiales bacterium]|nr:transcription termination factor Rho [Acidimicrobiales bacterium]